MKSQNVVVSVGLIVQNNTLLLVRSRDYETFSLPGGKPEHGESTYETLRRELQEELCIDTGLCSTRYIGRFVADSYDKTRYDKVILYSYLITNVHKQPEASAEIKELACLDIEIMRKSKLAPAIQHKYIPWLRRHGYLTDKS